MDLIKHVETPPPRLSSYVYPDPPVWFVAASTLEDALVQIYGPELMVWASFYDGTGAKPWWATLGSKDVHCRLEVRIGDDRSFDWVWCEVVMDDMVMDPSKIVKAMEVDASGFSIFLDSQRWEARVDFSDQDFFGKSLALVVGEIDWQFRREHERVAKRMEHTLVMSNKWQEFHEQQTVLDRNGRLFKRRAKRVRL